MMYGLEKKWWSWLVGAEARDMLKYDLVDVLVLCLKDERVVQCIILTVLADFDPNSCEKSIFGTLSMYLVIHLCMLNIVSFKALIMKK